MRLNFASRAVKAKEIISTFDFCNKEAQYHEYVKDVVALGKFNKQVDILSVKNDKKIGTLKGHVGGVTFIKFSPANAFELFTGARQDDLVYLWDLRKFDEFVTYY